MKQNVLKGDTAAEDLPPPLLLSWFFGQKLRQSIPADLDAYIEELGIASRENSIAFSRRNIYTYIKAVTARARDLYRRRHAQAGRWRVPASNCFRSRDSWRISEYRKRSMFPPQPAA